MRGLMMDYPLTLTALLERSTRLYSSHEIVSRTAGGRHRTTYGAMYARVHRLAGALAALGVARGDRVATFCWNHYRHLEVYFAAPCMGAVLHTLNFRLGPDQLRYIITHAADRVIIVDRSLLPLLLPLRAELACVEHIVVVDDGGGPASDEARGLLDYETLLAAAPATYDFPVLDEHAAAGMCYTSGTTGYPKGVLYSHRALCLHSLAEALPDVLDVSERDHVLMIVPMFHANAWGLPFTATMLGATQILPGPGPQPADIAQLIQDERVTIAAGVPTIWIGLLALLRANPGRYDLSSLHHLACGGSAVPRQLIEDYQNEVGVPIVQAWGMTETAPLATVSRVKSEFDDVAPAEQFAYRARQGLTVPFVELKIVDDSGAALPADGVTFGEIVVRGPWVISAYYDDPQSAERFTADGWFRTGDVATLDAEGYIQIVDRAKDVIKSGGEWISSVALEGALMGHPAVQEAAVVAVPHPLWQERPLACVVLRPADAGSVTAEQLRAHLATQFPKWWLPDDIVFIAEIPKTSVGKFFKSALREQFRDYNAAATAAAPEVAAQT